LEDNTKITLIDYEYGGWNPMAMDIANYLNECAIDNAYPKGFGIKYYPENFPSEFERNTLIKSYLKLYYEQRHLTGSETSQTYEIFDKENFERFELEVKRCCLLSSF
jgi:thiamine kinase-like enzyme